MKKEIIGKIFVDDRKEMYSPLVAADWAGRTLNKSKNYPKLDPIIVDLLATWRPVTFTAAMPAAIVDMVAAFADSFSNSHVPEGSVTRVANNAMAALSRAIPELVEDGELRGRIQTKLLEIIIATKDVESTPIKYDSNWLWKQYMALPQFQMMLWSSQRVAFTGLYNAYEATLVRLAKNANQLESLRVTQKKEFNKCLRDLFGDDGRNHLWTNETLNSIRLVRHSLSHAAGSVTADLKSKKHGFMVIDGKIQILAKDNHKLIQVLCDCVDHMVEKAIQLPAFQNEKLR